MNVNNKTYKMKSITVLIMLLLAFYQGKTQEKSRNFWTEEQSPQRIGELVINELISREKLMYYTRHHNNMVHYAEACAGMGAVRLANSMGNKDLIKKLDERYRILIDQADTFATNHVDANVLGILPLELYLCMGDEKYREIGLSLADIQWDNPLENGMTKQTRYWIDDVFMIGALQTQAYRVTGNELYINRAALQIDDYMQKLQQPNGLFFHGPEAQHFWGRGNGWVAAGLATVITNLPKSSPYYQSLLQGYQKMMEALLKYQAGNGMWRQLIDNEASWEETSCTAMFGYAMKIGVDKGLINGEAYEEACRKAWIGLVSYLADDGRLNEICIGTGQSTQTQFYLDRPRRIGDLHGQAPLLWFAGSWLSDTKN